MEMTYADLLDRYSILMLKIEKGLDFKKEFLLYHEEIKNLPFKTDNAVKLFYEINKSIWGLESAIRQQLIDDDDITGIQAKKVRRLNDDFRVVLKNIITDLTSNGYKESKVI